MVQVGEEEEEENDDDAPAAVASDAPNPQKRKEQVSHAPAHLDDVALSGLSVVCRGARADQSWGTAQTRYVQTMKKAKREGPPRSVRFTAETEGEGPPGPPPGFGGRGVQAEGLVRGGAGGRGGKPCFTFSQTGKCKFGARCALS